MSRHCYVYLSVLLTSTFMSLAAAMDQTLTLPDYDFSLDTHTYTPTPKPAPLSNSFKTAGVCFLGYGDCGNAGFLNKGSSSGGGSGGENEDFKIDTVQQC